jgi:hypothetical protein
MSDVCFLLTGLKKKQKAELHPLQTRKGGNPAFFDNQPLSLNDYGQVQATPEMRHPPKGRSTAPLRADVICPRPVAFRPCLTAGLANLQNHSPVKPLRSRHDQVQGPAL